MLVAVPRWLLGAKFTKSVLYAGNMVQKPIPSSNEIEKKNMVVIERLQSIIHPQALNPKKQKDTKYMPA